MERLFQPSKWLVIFCICLIVIWSSLRYVIVTRLTEEAKLQAHASLNWDWKNLSIQSHLDRIDTAKIIKQNSSGNDAIVEMTGTKLITSSQNNSSVKIPFKMKVYLYSLNNKWIIGAISQE